MRKVYIKSLKKNPTIALRKLKSLALRMLELTNAPKTIELGITLVDDQYIQNLNRKYRKVNSPTDVLAFPITVAPNKSVGACPMLLGDIYISLDRANEQIVQGETLGLEVSHLLIHGILHLLGYEHSKQMKTQEEYYFHKLVLITGNR